MSYLNWPYGHGVALGDVWQRVYDVDMAYSRSADDLRRAVEKTILSMFTLAERDSLIIPDALKSLTESSGLE